MKRNKILTILLAFFTLAVSWFHAGFEVDAPLEWWNVLISVIFICVWLFCILLCRKSRSFQIFSVCYWLFVSCTAILWTCTDPTGSLLILPMLFGTAPLYGFSYWAESQNFLFWPTFCIALAFLALSAGLLLWQRKRRKKTSPEK